MSIRVNITTRVNRKNIERVTRNGRPHWKVSSFTLPFDVVMNDVLYPRAEIEANYKTLDGTFAPLGHPVVDGQFVSAFTPQAVNAFNVGAWNENARIEGGRVAIDKIIDIEAAQRSPRGPELLERLEAIARGEAAAVHTSVAAFIDELPAPDGAEYGSVAKILTFDHDAILLDEPGAATPEQGVGLMVNADLATRAAPKVNAGALRGISYREREAMLDAAAKLRFAPGDDDYAWVVDFTDTQAVVRKNGGPLEMYDYALENGKITFADAGMPVAKQESWVAIATNKLKAMFNPQARPAVNEKEGQHMPITAEEQAAITQSVVAAMATPLGDITAQLGELKANQDKLASQIAAPAQAAEAAMRADVAKVHGDLVANSLQGDALKDLHSKLGTAATLAGNSAGGAPTTNAFATPVE